MASERESKSRLTPFPVPFSRRRPRVLVLTSDALFAMFFPPATIARLEETADWEQCRDRVDSPGLRARIARSDALITTWHSPFLRAVMLEGTTVRLVVHCGGELEPRMEAAVLGCVSVVTTPEPMAAPVAEMALAMALSLVRRLPDYDREMRGGGVPNNESAARGETLAGRRVGVVGFGRVGRAFADLIRPLGVELVISDPRCSVDIAEQSGAKLVPLDELLRSSSIVVLASALTPETRGLLDARRLALLPDGAHLINVARGGLIELSPLLEELRTGRITAALDVTDPLEPLPLDHELRRLPNVLLTPHVAAGGIEVRHAMGSAAVREIAEFFGRNSS